MVTATAGQEFRAVCLLLNRSHKNPTGIHIIPHYVLSDNFAYNLTPNKRTSILAAAMSEVRESMVDCLWDQLIPPACLLVSRRGISRAWNPGDEAVGSC